MKILLVVDQSSPVCLQNQSTRESIHCLHWFNLNVGARCRTEGSELMRTHCQVKNITDVFEEPEPCYTTFGITSFICFIYTYNNLGKFFSAALSMLSSDATMTHPDISTYIHRRDRRRRCRYVLYRQTTNHRLAHVHTYCQPPGVTVTFLILIAVKCQH